MRVRVRPAADDFVTAESQHFNSALNGLFRDQYKYNPVRQSKPSFVSSFASPEKSIVQDLVTDILKNDEVSTEWATHPAITTTPPSTETTEIQITTIPTKTEETTIAETTFDDLFVKLTKKDTGKIKEEEKKERRKEKVEGEMEEDTWESSKKWKDNVRNTVDFGNHIAGKYKSKDKDANDIELSRRVEKLSVDEKEAKRKNDIIESELNETDGEEEGRESRESLRLQNENFNHHPKNHRVKWSEVRYPSAFERSKPSNWKAYDSGKISGKATSIPGLVTKNEGDTSVKTLSDYVQAIFDTMKSAEEETNTSMENLDEITTTALPPSNTLHLPDRSNEEKSTKMRDDDGTMTTRMILEDGNEATESTASTTEENATTILARMDAISNATTRSSSAFEDNSASSTPLPATSSNATLSSNSTESGILGKVLRTSTTTKVSHMTEICYRGRCVMTRPSRDDRFR